MATLANGHANDNVNQAAFGYIGNNNLTNRHSHGVNGYPDQNQETQSGFEKVHARAPREPIAIVGMAFRLPGGIHSSEALWQLLIDKKTTRGEIPGSRYNIDGFYSASKKVGGIGTRYGHFLAESDRLEHFDTSLFSIGKSEVESLDPQQRMLLEVVWECMENAGQKNWRGSDTGVFVGTWGEEWLDLMAKDVQASGPYKMTNTADFVISNRVSYEYDLKGPSMTIKAACSSSMLCLHQACTAILNQDCSSALVAGTNLIMGPTVTVSQTEAGVLSPTGECKTFDASADGYSRAEAINVIYIKKLSDAINDKDPIRAIIRSTAANCDGTGAGLSNPNPEGHERLIRKAYCDAQFQFHETPFIECHGTGTPIGDPLELKAISKLFGGNKEIYIGSVKPNIGHAEGASGLNSIIKAVLALEHDTIPPNVNFQTPNPRIPFKEANLTVLIQPLPWPEGRPKRISVNSFGFTGANGHAILESANNFNSNVSRSEDATTVSSTHLLAFSAANAQSLKRNAEEMSKYAQRYPARLPDLTYTLISRRENLSHRAFCISHGATFGELMQSEKPKLPYHVSLVFTGQGAQWPSMGKELLKYFVSFDRDIDDLNSVLSRLPIPPTWNLKEELLKDSSESRLNDPELSQPVCTAVQIGLTNILKNLGVRLSAVVGHSSGEIAAAYAANALTSSEAIIVAYCRGIASKKVTRQGAMAAVALSREEANLYLERGVVVACENSPGSVTLSGDEDKLDSTIAQIKEDNPDLFVRKLQTGGMAYHSHHMREIGEFYEDLLVPHVAGHEPSTPFFSSVTAKRMSSGFGPSYWRQNLESPVRFSSAVRLLMDTQQAEQLLVEVGPHSALSGPLKQIFKDTSTRLNYVPTLIRGKDSFESILNTAGQLYLHHIPGLKLALFQPNGCTLTDLPAYQWNHDSTYWNESRISREWRMRTYPHHELLGSRVLDGTDFDPSWRNVLRLKDVPWLEDHKVFDDIVFPYAGYIAMTGEAIRQLTRAKSFSIRALIVKTALVLQDDHNVEIITSLRPVQLTNSLDSEWYSFTISSYNGKSWVKHAFGEIKSGQDIQISGSYHRSHHTKPLPRYVDTPYSAIKKLGLNYGPTFQRLEAVSTLPGKGSAVANVKNLEPSESYYHVHPSVLDSALHLVYFASTGGISRHLNRLAMPVSMENIFVAAGSAGASLKAWADATSPGNNGRINGCGAIYDEKDVFFIFRGGESAPTEDQTGAGDIDTAAGARIAWRQHLDFVDIESLMVARPLNLQEIKDVETYGVLCCMEMQSRLKDLHFSSGHLLKFAAWIDDHVKYAREGLNPLVKSGPKLAELNGADRMSSIDIMRNQLRGCQLDPAVELVSGLLDNLRAMFKGEIEPLEIYLKDDRLTKLYNLIAHTFELEEFFVTAGHTNPTMRILEIGAGTGGTANIALRALTSVNSEPMYSNYCYTDISSGFFSAAKERFAGYPGVEYKTLDIGKDPLEQGFESGTYDLIIASNVIHATPCLQTTLNNVRKLIHPHGRFFFQELTPSWSKIIGLIMGILPGWWLGDGDNRLNEPIVTSERWDKELRGAGFSGLESCLYNDPNEASRMGMNLVARPTQETQVFRSVTLLSRPTDFSSPLAKKLEETLVAQNYHVDWCSLDESPQPSQDIISLLELDYPFLHDMTSGDFASLQKFLDNVQSSKILWLTGSSQMDCGDPKYSLSLGLTRVTRSELLLPLATLELDTFDPSLFNAVVKVFEKYQSTADENANADTEYILKGSRVYVGRYHWNNVATEVSKSPGEDDKPLKLEIGKPGSIHSLRWVKYSPSSLGAEEVLVQPKCVGTNFRDILITMGLVAERGVGLGLEASGVVAATGNNVQSLKIGDRVMMINHNLFSTLTTIPAEYVIKIPDTLSFEDAATIPSVFSTAIHSLISMANLKKNQTVLIHSAAGGVGLAAIQICQMVGAKIYCTVSSEKKVRYLMEEFGIPRNHIFHSRDTSFLTNVMQETNNRGVDVVLNSLAGELLHTSWKCVAVRGKMLEIGKRDFHGHAKLEMDVFEANRSFIGVDLSSLQDIWHELLSETMKYLEQGYIKPLKTHIFDAAHIEDAFRSMQKGQHIGKLIVTIPDSQDEIPSTPVRQELQLRSDTAYLLVGGLGGLGRAVSTWMVERGARHLIYTSRSAGKSEEDQKFFKELEAQECSTQAFAVDITKREDVDYVMSSASKPISGVLQMAMVLRDMPLIDMTFEDWRTAVSPKVDGTWNLHHALTGVNLDFFVLFSSIAGSFGNIHQANYAAGNTFQDAFVQYRHSLGLPASAINIGSMEDVGYVSRNTSIKESLRATGVHFINETDLINALQLSILQSNPATSSTPPNKAGYMNMAQLAIGVRASKPMSDPSNRILWKRDKRMDIYRNLEASFSKNHSHSRADDPLKILLAEVEVNISLLDSKESLDLITREIGVCIYEFMLQPIAELDLSRSLSGLGVDSLVTIEIRNWFRRRMGVEVSTLEILSGATIEVLGLLTVTKLKEKFGTKAQ